MFRSLTLVAILIIVVIATSTSTSILAIGTSPTITQPLQTKFVNINTVSKLLTTPAPRNALLSEANTTNNATLTNNTSSAQPSSLASPAVIRAAISFGGIKNLSNDVGDSRNPLVDVSGNIVYVVWVDLTTPTGSGDILFKRSTDGGNTFGNTVNLSNDVGDRSTLSLVFLAV
jgi:hypothetical protein